MEHKHFSCPECGARFRKRNLFSIKVVCRECGGKFRYKIKFKHAVLQSFAIALFFFIMNGFLFYYNYNYLVIIFDSLAFLAFGIMIFSFLYRKAEFEKYYLP